MDDDDLTQGRDSYADMDASDLPPDPDAPPSDELSLARWDREHARHQRLYAMTGDLDRALAPATPPKTPAKVIPMRMRS